MQPTLTIAQQVDALESLGVFTLARSQDSEARAVAETLREKDSAHTLVALHPAWFTASSLAPLLRLNNKPGFVVEDMTDVNQFLPVGFTIPDSPLYLVQDVRRGDDLRNASPEEALAQFNTEGRRPLTLQEGLSWALTHPEVIEPNACFMTIGSRKVKQTRKSGEAVYDSRTPALWISSGSGRDGRPNKGAPKLGWCWWRNRHTWLGIASAQK